MVELQLEKLSPYPVAQVVWSACPVPPQPGAPPDKMQTLILVFAERRAVEEFLGQLEAEGYLADRLEPGLVDQLTAGNGETNGARIHPGALGRRNMGLVAWWFDGKLRNLGTITLPPAGDAGASLQEQLTQMTWAAELEGWLTRAPDWTLVADDDLAAGWETALRKALDAPVQRVQPLKPVELASLTARRAASAGGAASLVPVEISTRYRNQFWDSLWLRGALAVGGAYVLGVLIYFSALFVQDYRVSRVEAEVAGLGASYTNAIQLRERHQVLTTRRELKFAALDCWKVTAELMPAEVQLDGFSFSDGRKLALNGTAAADKVNAVLDFYGVMRKAALNGQPMFDPARGAELSTRLGPGGTAVNWNFGLELNRKEAQ
jgi:hypothetical protein